MRKVLASLVVMTGLLIATTAVAGAQSPSLRGHSDGAPPPLPAARPSCLPSHRPAAYPACVDTGRGAECD